MSKNIYYNLSGLTLLAILLVLGLFWNAERPYKIKNGFNRKNIEVLKQSLALRMPMELKGMAFDGNRYCYFYGKEPEQIKRINLMTLLVDSLSVPWKQLAGASAQFKLMADPGHLYIQFLNQRKVLSYHLNTAEMNVHSLARIPNQLALIAGRRLVMRAADSISRAPVLLKQGLVAGGVMARAKPWPNERMGVIPTDGEMHYDWITGLISYHYFYKNGFKVLDSNLHSICNGKTVDTVRRGNVKVKLINRAFTLAAPPRIVNGRGCVDAGKLYINGYFKADNEDTKDFRNHTVIDVYDMGKGVYLYSFYVPVFDGKKLGGFGVSGNKMICLYGNYVVVYMIKAVA